MEQTASTAQRVPQGTVTIAPAVLTTIVRLTALAEPGVLRLSSRAPTAIGRVLGRAAMAEGLRVEVHDDQTVTVELHVAADPNVNLKALGESLQTRVARAVEHMVGMDVRAVNVFIDEIEFGGTAR
ncbi:MAG: Asp23/Gls24 family envelope stress response protein [Caldilineales bacterium]|nr:Asp23/Gls24 family envelope stress response protein [Caldilineales bacterium]MDW8318118.1 Asp23/Gls24 family envelope stress response protein [Anaerolineae bacterium]